MYSLLKTQDATLNTGTYVPWARGRISPKNNRRLMSVCEYWTRKQWSLGTHDSKNMVCSLISKLINLSADKTTKRHSSFQLIKLFGGYKSRPAFRPFYLCLKSRTHCLKNYQDFWVAIANGLYDTRGTGWHSHSNSRRLRAA